MGSREVARGRRVIVPAGRGARSGVLALVGLVWAVMAADPASGQASGFEIEARGGVVFSTALVEGTVAFPAPSGDTVQTYEVVPVPAPMVVVAGRTGVGPGLDLEVSAGWSFSRLEGRQGRETWEVQDLGVGHVVVGLRKQALERLHVRGGLGLIRYGPQEGLLAGSRKSSPLAELAVGTDLEVGGARVAVAGVGQAHSFGSAAIRSGAGSGVRGQDGTIFRFAVQVGVTLGGLVR